MSEKDDALDGRGRNVLPPVDEQLVPARPAATLSLACFGAGVGELGVQYPTSGAGRAVAVAPVHEVVRWVARGRALVSILIPKSDNVLAKHDWKERIEETHRGEAGH